MKYFPLTLLMLVTLILPGNGFAQTPAANALRFSGYDWEVREQGVSGPGPNQWNPKNVWVDKTGDLHLKISRVNGANGDEWHCAEITSKKKFGFGRYEFQTVGAVDRLDHNIVLGLFDYPSGGEDPDGTNEIDIEFARWGNRANPNGSFTIYPASGARGKKDSFAFEYALPETSAQSVATHRFTRTKNQVALATFAGEGKAGDKPLSQWTYAPSETRLIPQKPLPVHLNLWLFQGKAPSDGKEVEIIVKRFSFTPDAAPSGNAQTAPKAPVRVGVFSERDFPTYGFNAAVTPQRIARDLRASGISADLLNVDALANATRFDATRYGALILPYGNTYPQEAFANLRRFHQAGGSLITTGVPFTHPVGRVAAADWSAKPGWGASVQRIAGAGPNGQEAALQIVGNRDDWTGVTSARFAVHPGDAVSGVASLRAAKAAVATGEADEKRDDLFVRFFDADGKFIAQEGTALAPAETWREFRVNAPAPAAAVAADISVQVRKADSRYLVARFGVSVNDRPTPLPNGDLSQRDANAWTDLGHTDDAARWGENGIGVGGFAGPLPGVLVTIPAADPWRLKGVIAPTANPRPLPQWVDSRTLPAGVTIVPALGDKSRPVAALVVHTGDAFAGAVDAWTLRGYSPDRDEYETEQIILRAALAALAHRGRWNSGQNLAVLRRMDALPRPPLYKNRTLPTVARRYSTLQPKMPALARHLYVADVRKLSPDEKLLLISLQGIVNRKQPRIYLIFDDDDALWLRETQKQKATDAPILVADPFSLLKTFRRSFPGMVVCDPKIYDSPCVAVALAGADNLLIARTAGLAARFRLPVKVDLRGAFRDNADALRFVRTLILPRLDPYLTCSLDPIRYDAGGLDHIIAARGSAFWITGPKKQNLPGANQEAETAEVRLLMSQLPLGAIVRGFWWNGDGGGMDEEAGVALGSRFGKPTLVSDLITNLSVHSGVPMPRLTQRPRPPAPPLDKSKVYLCFTMSDGDNLCTWRGYFRRYFEDPARGTVPVGWGMGPGIIDLAPLWAKWYYDAATPNDEFFCDVSGAAYIYPPDWGLALKDRSSSLRDFYKLTQTYMRRMDMKTIRLMNVDAPSIAQAGTLLPQIDFLMPDYGHAGANVYSELTYTLPTGQPVFRAATNGSGPENLAAQIRARAGAARPAFVNAFIWNWGSNLSDLKKTMEILGSDYIAVLPSQLNTLYRAAQKR